MSSPSVALVRRPRPVAFVLSLIVAWLLLGLVALWLRRGPIEDDLAARAATAVRGSGAVHAQVSTDGREILVHGHFDSAEDAERVLAAAAVSGSSSARLADDVVVATEPARPLMIGIERAGTTTTGLALSATVPDSGTRAALLGAAADAGGGAVSGTVTVDPRAAAPELSTFGEVAKALAAAPGTRSVTIDGSSLVLRGSAPDDAARSTIAADVLAAARAALPEASLANELTVTPPDQVTLDPATGAIVTGIPATGDAATGRPAAGAPAAGETGEALRRALDGSTLAFPVGAAGLSPSVRADLDRVARALLPGDLTVIVGGHTDSTGPLAFNQALSLDRARGATDYLVGRGVPASRLRAAGFGPDQPVADNSTAAGRAANRRIDLTPVAD